MSTNRFVEPYRDFIYLKKKGYPEKASLKLIGDRYRLSRVGRNCLFRGTVVESTALERRRKLAGPREVKGRALGIDWYNVVITVESHLKGAVLFIADDEVLRDSSATHGSFRRSEATVKARLKILESILELQPSHLDVFLDSPIAFSAVMAGELRELLSRPAFPPSEVWLEKSADFPLKNYKGLVASSDSVVLDASSRAFDLARFVLERRFGFKAPRLRDLDLTSSAGPGRLFESETL
jgi:hypothetical protein